MPLVAFGVPLVPSNTILVTIELLLVLTRVANGVSAALLATSRRCAVGLNAISSTRLSAGVPVATLAICGLPATARLNAFSVLSPLPAYSTCWFGRLTTSTPFGPEMSLLAGGAGRGRDPGETP